MFFRKWSASDVLEFNEDEFSRITSPGLMRLIEQERLEQDKLRKENFLLEKYLELFGVKKEVTISQETPSKPAKAVPSSLAISKSLPYMPHLIKPGGRKIESSSYSASIYDEVSKHSELQADNFLTFERKCEIAADQIKEMKQKFTKLHLDWYPKITSVKVKLEDVIIATKLLKQDQDDFQRDVIECGVDVLSGKTMLEKVMVYFNRSVRKKEIQAERCQLEQHHLSQVLNNLNQQIKKLNELAVPIDDVDYKKIKILNKKSYGTVDDKNRLVSNVKTDLNMTLQVLRQDREKLDQLKAQGGVLKGQVEKRRNKIVNIERDIKRCTEEKNKLRREVDTLKTDMENYRVPDVMDYVNVQAEVYELNKLVKVWQRKVSVAERSCTGKFKPHKVSVK